MRMTELSMTFVGRVESSSMYIYKWKIERAGWGDPDVLATLPILILR